MARYNLSQREGVTYYKGKVNIMLPQILRRKEVQKWVGVGRSTLHTWVKEGHFPKPIKLNFKEGQSAAVGWREEDLMDWFNNLKETK